MSHILVVDDEPDIEVLFRQCFRKEIKSERFTFHFTGDGIEALEKLNSTEGISIVVTDINMPRMDGLTLLERLSEFPEPPETVVISAYSDLKNIRKAMNIGAFDFVTKPVDLDDLVTTVNRLETHQKEIQQLRQDRKEAQKTKAHLSRYFSPSVLKSIAANDEKLSRIPSWSQATFIFTDLASFLPFVQKTEPETTVAILGEYFDKTIDIIFRHDGTLMKIIGDALHITFGAPEYFDDHAEKALRCAIELDEYAREFTAQQQAKGIPFGATRIGVHSGEALIGNFGGSRFFDYTAYGDAVNIAARLEAANKIFGTTLCVSEETVKQLQDFRGREIGALRLKGSENLLSAFEPSVEDAVSDDAIAEYNQAFEMLKAGDSGAREAFATLLAKNASDALCAFHMGRVLSGQLSVEIKAY